VEGVLEEIARLPGAELRPPARDEDVRRVELEWEISFPSSFRRLLARTNGVSWKDGFGRLFGVGEGATRELGSWNSPTAWKFRYPELWSHYLSIGEDAWGNQWAFRADELRGTEPDPPVWFLSPQTMDVSRSPVGTSLAAYLEKGVLFNARGYWEPFDLEVKLRFPTLPADRLLVHAPPLRLIDAEPDSDQVMMLPAEQVMRIHADAWEAAQSWPEGAALASFGLEPDDDGWLRLIPVWST
jgi:hypothetical protein